MILTREHIDATLLPGAVWLLSQKENARDTSLAYHDLRDAVLALHVETMNGDQMMCAHCWSTAPCATMRAVDPRVEVVAAALLDTYDETVCACGAPLALGVVHRRVSPCYLPTDEADLRERIAVEIDAYAPPERDRDDVCAALAHAARIARGTDPGKDTR